MNEKTKQTAHQAIINDDDALLAQYNFGDLPVVFSMRDGSQIIQEKEACYLCTAEGFYGQGKGGTWYAEGSIIVGAYLPPNYHLQPLNRAAALRWTRWVSSLPRTRVPYDISDMAQAAQELATDPTVHNLSPNAYQAKLISQCEQVKMRREGGTSLNLPGLNHNFAPQSGGNAPPILGAKQAEMGQQGPGSLHGGAAQNAGGVRRAAAPANVSAGNSLGGPAPV